ncbi:MAG: hypothetical protein ACXIUB_03015 [Wenzhouxiangella sp.]
MKLSVLLAATLGLPLFLGLAALGMLQLRALDMAPLFLAMMLVDELTRPEWLLLLCLLLASQLEPRGALALLSQGWRMRLTPASNQASPDAALATAGPASLLLAPSAALIFLAVALGDQLSNDGQLALTLHRMALVPVIPIAVFSLWAHPDWRRSLLVSPRAWASVLAIAAFYLGLLPLVWLILSMLLLAHVAWWRGRAGGAANDDKLGDYIDRLSRASVLAGALLLLFGLSMVLMHLAEEVAAAPWPIAFMLWALLIVGPLLLGRRLPPLVWIATLAPWLPWAGQVLSVSPITAGIVLVLLLSAAWFWPTHSSR